MKRKLPILLIIISLLLAAAGCRLARPEKEQNDWQEEDRFCGFYVVPYKNDGSAEPDEDGFVPIPGDFYDNPNLTVYGSQDMDVTGDGSIHMDREVLFAQGQGRDVQPVFPGMPEGYYLITYEYTDEEGSHTQAILSNMGPGGEPNSAVYRDQGMGQSVGGTIYYGPPADAPEDWWELQDSGIFWRAYQVWETADQRLYLDGSGNSYSGPGNKGFSQTHTYTYRENGEDVRTDSITADVSLEAVPRLERLTIYQFDGESRLLGAETVPLSAEFPDFHCAAGVAWVVVESESAQGAAHTAYDLAESGEDGVWHDAVLLDGDGFGTLAQLHILPR